MALIPINSVNGYSTGLTMTSVIDATGNIIGVLGTFSSLLSANAGINASGGVTFAGTLQGTTAAFTGLVSSTTGFSGSGTNLTNIVKTFNGLSNGVTLAAGTNITLTPVGNTITIAASGSGGGPTMYVESFNGLTGAVTGVSSVNGLTGSVPSMIDLYLFSIGII